MSLVAQKRNAQRYCCPVSGGKEGFSIVGGYRNQGWVGQTSLSRSVTRTPFKGTLPKGHGGCCGTYDTNYSNSGACCVNDPSIIKSANKNTHGMIAMKYRWMKRGYPYFWVQDTGLKASTSSEHTRKIREDSAAGKCGVYTIDAGEMSPCVVKRTNNGQPSGASACVQWIGGVPHLTKWLQKNGKGAVSSSEYMNTRYLQSKCLPTPANQQPFPTSGIQQPCGAGYITWEQAQAAGALPQDYKP